MIGKLGSNIEFFSFSKSQCYWPEKMSKVSTSIEDFLQVSMSLLNPWEFNKNMIKISWRCCGRMEGSGVIL